MPEALKELMAVKQAAERAAVSPALIYAWCSAGLLPHMRLGLPGKRGCIRIAEADLDAFLASQKREGRQEAPSPPRQPAMRLKHLHLPS